MLFFFTLILFDMAPFINPKNPILSAAPWRYHLTTIWNTVTGIASITRLHLFQINLLYLAFWDTFALNIYHPHHPVPFTYRKNHSILQKLLVLYLKCNFSYFKTLLYAVDHFSLSMTEKKELHKSFECITLFATLIKISVSSVNSLEKLI